MVDASKRALDDLFPDAYDRLRSIAHRARATPLGTGRDTTSIVHDAYVRLAGGNDPAFENQAQLLRVAAVVMRRLLVDCRRRSTSQKRGGHHRALSLREGDAILEPRDPDVIAIDEALDDLAAVDPRKSQVVEMRYFGGCTFREIATALGISVGAVFNEWSFARAWLCAYLNGSKNAAEPGSE